MTPRISLLSLWSASKLKTFGSLALLSRQGSGFRVRGWNSRAARLRLRIPARNGRISGLRFRVDARNTRTAGVVTVVT